ncbi:hypothetical protein BGZ65_012795, partial [Modicella reniformis]
EEGNRPETPNKHIVKRPAKSIFEHEVADTPRFWIVKPLGDGSALPITRLAWSKDSSFLAALAVKKTSVHITVWDLKSIENIPEQTGDESVLRPSYATADTIQETSEPEEPFSNLSIGLAISPKGDQVAIYQEPKIGQWKDGSRLPQCSFPIRLFNNPLIPNKDSITVEVAENERHWLLQQATIPHRIFDSFVGYGGFLTENEKVDLERPSVSTVFYNNTGAESSDEITTDSSGTN